VKSFFTEQIPIPFQDIHMAKQFPLAQVIEQLEQGLPSDEGAGFIGARLDPGEAALLLIPVPWEATTSYGGGTSQGPEAIRKASHQLDLEDAAFGQPYRAGISFIETDDTIARLNLPAREAALTVIEALERGGEADAERALVNRASQEVNRHVHQQAGAILAQGKLAAVVGGDHASPQGLIQALAERHETFGILHLDAHLDLREAYEGFVGSHASIFYNVMEQLPQVTRLVQVGIRDYSRAEVEYARKQGDRVAVFYGADLFRSKAAGVAWLAVCEQIIESLPQQVYISFDIDALDPPYCPHTGTPVPGGLSFDEACYLLERLVLSGRQIIGFDLCEVAPADGDEWDANVGARILYKLCGATLRSQGKC
jgi:agmatinase